MCDRHQLPTPYLYFQSRQSRCNVALTTHAAYLNQNLEYRLHFLLAGEFFAYPVIPPAAPFPPAEYLAEPFAQRQNSLQRPLGCVLDSKFHFHCFA